jgi:hypothetical protein
MFRIVKEFVPQPSFLVVCDHAHCGVHISQILTPGADLEVQAGVFIHTATDSGWALSMMGQLCPGHNPAQAEAKRVELYSAILDQHTGVRN